VSSAPLLLETLTRVAAFGVRFWDAALGRPVDDGLQVTLLPAGQTFRRIPAFRNTSGVFVAQNLPGLRAWEFGDEPLPASPGDGRPFRIEVVDLAGRFHAVSFDADLPFVGLFEEMCGSPPSPPEGVHDVVPLFSLPSRAVPPGFAAVRARLTLADGSGAHLASLDVAGVRGFADARGEILTLVPYPEPSGSTGSPPFEPGGKLTDQTWQVEIAASLPASTPDPLLPDLCAFAVRRAAMFEAGGTAFAAAQTLVYGRDLVLPELVVVPS
jgi:hypothetical protein